MTELTSVLDDLLTTDDYAAIRVKARAGDLLFGMQVVNEVISNQAWSKCIDKVRETSSVSEVWQTIDRVDVLQFFAQTCMIEHHAHALAILSMVERCVASVFDWDHVPDETKNLLRILLDHARGRIHGENEIPVSKKVHATVIVPLLAEAPFSNSLHPSMMVGRMLLLSHAIYMLDRGRNISWRAMTDDLTCKCLHRMSSCYANGEKSSELTDEHYRKANLTLCEAFRSEIPVELLSSFGGMGGSA